MRRGRRFDNPRYYVRYATCDGGQHQAAVPLDASEHQIEWSARWCDSHDRPGKYDRGRGNAMEPCPGVVTIHELAEVNA